MNGLGLGAVPSKRYDRSSTRDTSHPASGPCVASAVVRSSTAAFSFVLVKKTPGQSFSQHWYRLFPVAARSVEYSQYDEPSVSVW